MQAQAQVQVQVAAVNGQHFSYGFFGLAMGMVLGLSGFADFEQVHQMFVFEDLRLLMGFAGAVGLSMMGFFILARRKDISKKKYNKGTIPGSILFGAGWAICGACPSIALVQLGQGQFAAMYSLFGIVFGVWVYRALSTGNAVKLDNGVCGED